MSTSDSYLNTSVEDLTTVIILIVGMFLLCLFIDWLRKKIDDYPMLP